MDVQYAVATQKMMFRAPCGFEVVFAEPVWERILSFRQVSVESLESGGILLGRIFEDQRRYVVDEITQPMPSDRATRSSFYRSKAHHKVAVKRWRESKGYCSYLGLWHTHPELIPTPSGVDKKDWELAVSNGRSAGEVMLFLIVGNQASGLWMRSTKIHKLIRLIPSAQKSNQGG